MPCLGRGRAVAEAANWARDLVNEPRNVLTPPELARRAETMGACSAAGRRSGG